MLNTARSTVGFRMCLVYMAREQVGTGKAKRAFFALVRSVASVGPQVTADMLRPGEGRRTELPGVVNIKPSCWGKYTYLLLD